MPRLELHTRRGLRLRRSHDPIEPVLERRYRAIVLKRAAVQDSFEQRDFVIAIAFVGLERIAGIDAFRALRSGKAAGNWTAGIQ